MAFGFETINREIKTQHSKPILGLDLDSAQIWIWVIWIIISFIFFSANIWLIWKIIWIGQTLLLSYKFAKKYNNNEDRNNWNHTTDARTVFEWFLISLRSILKWSLSIKKGADYNSFKK